MSSNHHLIKEAAKYFGAPAFSNLMQQMIERYRGLGRIGGSVKLTNPSPETLKAVGGVLGKDLTGKKEVTVSLTTFDQAIQETRFAGVTLFEILNHLAGGNLTTKSEESQQEIEARSQLLAKLQDKYLHQNVQEFLSDVLDQDTRTHPLIKRAHSRPTFCEEFEDVLSAISQLPTDNHQDFQRLPIWATKITGDPHAFDANTNRGKLLLAALEFLYTYHNPDTDVPEGYDLLEQFGIVRDDLLNFVTCVGLIAETENGPHSVWVEAAKNNTVMNVPLRELAKITKIYPKHNNKVYVLENPGVFSAIADAIPDAPPLVCIHGQPRTATWMLLERITKEIEILYSGDFDPEGILIAQRICQRYQNARPWRYTVEDYHKCMSEVIVSEKRLLQLQQVEHRDLASVSRMIGSAKRAGYQEQLLDEMVREIEIGKLKSPAPLI
jgi:uncharacterized protein (TIGR02679 family)